VTADPVSPAALRVLVVDDHALFRGGLTSLLREHGIEVVGEAGSGEEGVRLAAVRAPQIIVMDLGLPGCSGIEAIQLIREQQPAARIVVLTASLDEDDVVEALIAGASGYLLKDAPVEEIAAALRAALEGDAVISPRVNRRLVERLRVQHAAQPQAGTAELTDRERQILERIVAGEDNVQIAAALFLSPSTVKNHVSAILAKLRVENRIQAAVHAVRAGLV
jgi:two-component system NarL family response regulator